MGSPVLDSSSSGVSTLCVRQRTDAESFEVNHRIQRCFRVLFDKDQFCIVGSGYIESTITFAHHEAFFKLPLQTQYRIRGVVGVAVCLGLRGCQRLFVSDRNNA